MEHILNPSNKILDIKPKIQFLYSIGQFEFHCSHTECKKKPLEPPQFLDLSGGNRVGGANISHHNEGQQGQGCLNQGKSDQKMKI